MAINGRFEAKHIIVTGAGQGIGRAIALRFAEEGAQVMLVGRTAAALEQTRTVIQKGGGSAWPQTADISKSEQIQGLVATALERWPTVDVLVNNAGILGGPADFLDIAEASWRNVLGTNLTGVFMLSQAIARQMVASGGGAIVHVSSVDAWAAESRFAAYSASKSALIGLTRSMALELAPHNIRVNAVCPGYTDTPMTGTKDPSVMEYLRHRFDRVPMHRLVRPEEVASGCAFLASGDASAITGTTLTIDCGLSANLYVLETLPASPT